MAAVMFQERRVASTYRNDDWYSRQERGTLDAFGAWCEQRQALVDRAIGMYPDVDANVGDTVAWLWTGTGEVAIGTVVAKSARHICLQSEMFGDEGPSPLALLINVNGTLVQTGATLEDIIGEQDGWDYIAQGATEADRHRSM